MANEPKPNEPKPKRERDPVILTRSEHEKLSAADKEAFRIRGGTVCEDAAIPS